MFGLQRDADDLSDRMGVDRPNSSYDHPCRPPRPPWPARPYERAAHRGSIMPHPVHNAYAPKPCYHRRAMRVVPNLVREVILVALAGVSSAGCALSSPIAQVRVPDGVVIRDHGP